MTKVPTGGCKKHGRGYQKYPEGVSKIPVGSVANTATGFQKSPQGVLKILAPRVQIPVGGVKSNRRWVENSSNGYPKCWHTLSKNHGKRCQSSWQGISKIALGGLKNASRCPQNHVWGISKIRAPRDQNPGRRFLATRLKSLGRGCQTSRQGGIKDPGRRCPKYRKGCPKSRHRGSKMPEEGVSNPATGCQR